MKRLVVIPVFVGALSGCAVQLHGNQATSGGAIATATSSAVVASTASSNAAMAFSFGGPVSPAAPGGQLSVSGGGGSVAAVLLVTAVVVELLNSLGGAEPPVKPLPPDARLSHTCSCYGYKPPQAAAGDR